MIVLDTVQCQIFTKSDENDGKYFPLEEYDDDHSDSDDCETNSPTIRYIEAKTGTKFQIRLTVLTGFKWRGADALLANYDFDGGALRGGKYLLKDKTTGSGDIVTRTKTAKCKRTHANVNGNMCEVTFAFGQADMSIRLIVQ